MRRMRNEKNSKGWRGYGGPGCGVIFGVERRSRLFTSQASLIDLGETFQKEVGWGGVGVGCVFLSQSPVS